MRNSKRVVADDIALGHGATMVAAAVVPAERDGDVAANRARTLAQLSNALAQLLKAEPGSSHEPERSDASQPPVEPDSRVAAQ